MSSLPHRDPDFAPPPINPAGEYPVLPPEPLATPGANVGDTSQAGLPYEPYQQPPADPAERQYSLLQILGLTVAAAGVFALVRKMVADGGPAVAATVIGILVILLMSAQALFRPPWALFNLVTWLLLGAYLVSMTLAFVWG